MSQMFVPTGEMNPWCGVCGSRDLKFCEEETAFETVAQAAPYLANLESQEMAIRDDLDGRGETHDIKQIAKN